MSSPSSAASPAPGAQEEPVPMQEDENTLSVFPGPPRSLYQRYTAENLALAASGDAGTSQGKDADGQAFDLAELEPPRVDWVEERGRGYQSFGETWPVDLAHKEPELKEMGVQELFNRTDDRQTSLQTLLRSLLVTYSTMIHGLLQPPPALGSQEPPEWQRQLDHIRLIAINMHYLINELRPIQAKEGLKEIMRSQIAERKKATEELRARCTDMKEQLAQARQDLRSFNAPSMEETYT